MTPETVIVFMQQAMQVTLLLLAALLAPVLIVGLLVSVFQAATQINEMTLSFVPKLIAAALVFVIGGPWMLQLMVNYTRNLIESIPGLIG
ncbi:MAG: flagellar biosynthetic protein FliQ [Gammaproteobacteria bacterium]|nr:MAG: flagellar biosynthetic protein FliQ [Gammaproteobacteria bacterium]